MRDFLAVLTLLACVVTLVLSLVALVKPMPRLGMATRERVSIGIIVAFALFVGFIALIPGVPENKKAAAVALPDPAEKILPRARFEIFSPTGNALDAKAAGFRECSSDYYAATCRNPSATLMGIPAPAVVRMDIENGKMPRDLSKLRYGEIEFSLPVIRQRYPCPADTDRDVYACDEKGPTLDLQRKLVGAGWQMHEWRGTRTYYHPGFTVSVVVMDSRVPGQENGVELQETDAESVQSMLQKIKDDRADKMDQKSAVSAFEQKMAQP